MMNAEEEHKRQLELADKKKRYHETDNDIRSKLSDSSSALYQLSVFLSIISRRRLKQEYYLFKEELAAAKELAKKRVLMKKEELAAAKELAKKRWNQEMSMKSYRLGENNDEEQRQRLLEEDVRARIEKFRRENNDEEERKN